MEKISIMQTDATCVLVLTVRGERKMGCLREVADLVALILVDHLAVEAASLVGVALVATHGATLEIRSLNKLLRNMLN